MKKSVTPISLFLVAFNFTIAQNSCSKFHPMEEGTSFQYTNYDKKEKTEGVLNYTISSVIDNGSSTTAALDMRFVDKKGKDIFNSNYNITCENGVVRVDYTSLFPSQMMQQYSGMGIEMDITGTDIEIPKNLSAGQQLADANVSIAMSMSGIKMNTTVDQTNRKVEKKESITVAAGTFECYLMTEKNISKTMGATIEMTIKQWLAEGVGMVKQKSYNRNGSLMSRMELTKFSK
ncbi:MAG: hypothetical protein ACJAU2_001477 [Maribacter sp.]|jgi:hypothetical protein